MTTSFGLDFGTTNTVIARCLPDGGAAPIPFAYDGATLAAIRSVLCFWLVDTRSRKEVRREAGPWAIEHFLDDPGDCRFLQSLKTFAASPGFEGTLVYNRRYGFEDLMGALLRGILAHAPDDATLPEPLVVGRPVAFAGHAPDPDLAHERYRAALAGFGVKEIRFVYEPVGAAFFFAQRLTRDANVLVADFGGGTSDFSIMRFERTGNRLRSRALAWSGVGIAGDTFDFRIIDNLIAPRLGKHSSYRSMGKVLPMPRRYYDSFARWSELSIMKTTEAFRDLKRVQRMSLEPDLIQDFVDLIEADLGFAIYRAVSDTKEALSAQESATFTFKADAIDMQAEVARTDFENWIADDLSKIAATVDVAMQRAELRTDGIDKVFLTGGSSFVPAVRRLFADRFGADKVETGEELVSVATGLALIGERDDIDQWCVA